MGDTFLGAVLNNLMAIMPFVIVRSFERGVRWTWGCDEIALVPGFWWRIPIVHSIEVIPITDEAMELPVQTILTADDPPKHVSFTVNIAYFIDDIVAHWNGVDDFEASTMALAMTHLAKRVRGYKFAELVAKTDDIERSLAGTLTTKFRSWGTKVTSVGFTNLAETEHMTRLFVDIPKSLSIMHGRDH